MTDSQTLTALSLIVVLEMKAKPTLAGEGEEHASVVSEASVDAQVAHLLTSQQTAHEQTACNVPHKPFVLHCSRLNRVQKDGESRIDRASRHSYKSV